MLRDTRFLHYKPSRLAAAAFMLALNANLDTALAKVLKVELLADEHISVDSYF